MSKNQSISRRDWFRLQAPQASPPVSQERHGRIVGNGSPGLEPIPHPVNHDGMDLSTLPPMREAMLVREEVQQLFSDIEALASNILLMQRSPGARRAAASRATTREQLATARDSLLSGGIPRVQIRYQWQNADWIDTLENHDGAYRLVRIAHTTGDSSS